MGLARESGGGFQQRPILAIASRMVLTCPSSACAQAEDTNSSAAANQTI
jgi:hypothetical protein